MVLLLFEEFFFLINIYFKIFEVEMLRSKRTQIITFIIFLATFFATNLHMVLRKQLNRTSSKFVYFHEISVH